MTMGPKTQDDLAHLIASTSLAIRNATVRVEGTKRKLAQAAADLERNLELLSSSHRLLDRINTILGTKRYSRALSLSAGGRRPAFR